MVSNIKLHSQKVAYKNSKMTLILSVAFWLAMLSFLPAFPALPCHCDTKYQETLRRAEQQQGAAPTAPDVWVGYLSYNTPGFSSFVTVTNGLIQMSTILSSVIGNEGFPTVWVYWSKHDFRLLNKNLVLVLASLMSTSHNLESFEKGNLPWENHIHQLSLCESLCHIFLFKDWGGRVQHAVSSTTPGLVILSATWKQAE